MVARWLGQRCCGTAVDAWLGHGRAGMGAPTEHGGRGIARARVLVWLHGHGGSVAMGLGQTAAQHTEIIWCPPLMLDNKKET